MLSHNLLYLIAKRLRHDKYKLETILVVKSKLSQKSHVINVFQSTDRLTLELVSLK